MLLTLLALQCFVTGATAMNGSLASQGSFASPDALDDDVMNGSDVSPIRDNATVPKVYERQLMPLPKLKWISGPVSRHRVHTIVMMTVTLTVLTTLGMMWQPGAAQGGTARLPPRWEPGSNTSFRAWTQDLMLWSISSDAEPHQQCALVISQLGGAAREVARTMSPAEVMNGGVVNGQHLDPLSYLIHGLSSRFGPLDDEVRLRSAQDLLSFSRRTGESTDTVLSRFDIVRQRARADGGGATVSTETAALILLRAVGANHTQFQQLTQPFGYRLPSTEQEFLHMTSAIRRLGHIVESHRDNIASTLRGNQGSNHYWAGASPSDETGPNQEDGQEADGADAGGNWSYLTNNGESDTDSATSSDNNSLMDISDLNGMSSFQVDEYLFGRYQHAKKRWRRFTGKPVRALRRVLRRKGKGKGSKGGLGHAYVNINETLQQSSFYKGKGKGGKSSGKGFGRRLNPKGRDGEVLKCSICQSQYHLRARCPQRSDASQPAAAATSSVGQIHHTSQANQASRSMYVHFAAFQAQPGSEQSWSRIGTPREDGGNQEGQQQSQEGVSTPNAANARPGDRTPEVYHMTPDPLQENDPWRTWMTAERPQGSASNPIQPAPSHWQGPAASTLDPGISVPAWHVPDVRSFLEVSGLSTTRPMVGSGTEQMVLPPVPTAYTAATQALQAMVEPALSGGAVASEAAGLFTQVHAGRQERRRESRSHREQQEEQQEPEPQAAQTRESRPRGDGGLEVYQDTCTICLNRFAAEDHCCRLQCRHVFHCVCVGEYLQHNAPIGEGDIRLVCPNCREDTQVDRSWVQPTFNLHAQPTVEEQLNEAVQTPVPSEASAVSAEEYVTPDNIRSYPWWPIPETNPPTPADATESSHGYHSTVRCDDGQLGLLVDPGSYGNLAGSGWVEEVEKTLQSQGKTASRETRSAPLRVGGVGKGSQNCREDVVIPLAIPRSDGTVKGGTYSAPVIEGSNAPALLGLKSLTQHRAVLDLVSNQLHLLGPGESRFELAEGTETFNLTRAATGHLLLPFQEFSRLASGSQGVRHLFSEEGIHESGYMTTVKTEQCKQEPTNTPEDADRASEPAAASPVEPSIAVASNAPEENQEGQSREADSQAPTSPADEPAPEAGETVTPVPAAEAEEAKSSSPEVTAANEAVPPVSVEATAEPKAEPASRHTGDFKNLTLDEIADREGYPEEKELTRDPSGARSRRGRRRRRKRRCEAEEEEDPAGSPDEEGRGRRRKRSPVSPGAVPRETKRWASQGSQTSHEEGVERAPSSATDQTSAYDTDRGSVVLTPRREGPIDKSYVALPSETITPKSGSASSSARPAEVAKACESVAAQLPKERGAGKSSPPLPPPPRRLVTREDDGQEYEVVRGERLPPPPRPKRLLQPPPEPKNPPTAKTGAAGARPLQRGTDAEIAKAEAHLTEVMANPSATRTAKRKARREVRQARGEPPPS